MKCMRFTGLAAAVLLLAVQAAGAVLADRDVRLTGSTDSRAHGSFGLMLAGGKGHLTRENEDGDRIFKFEDEPRVLKVFEDGPADGILRAGDVIVAIDGLAITSEDAGWMLQHPLTGRTYELVIRRGERERRVEITAGEPDRARANDNTIEVVTSDDEGNMRVVSYTLNEAGDVARMSERSSSGGNARTRSWFGLGLESGSVIVKRAGDDHSYVYFDDPPRVYSVDPDGPAGRAGIRRGDVIVKVDGLRLDEDEGGERWSIIEPGEDVEVLYMRDGDIYTVQLEAEDHPTWTVGRQGVRVVRIHEAGDTEDGHLRYAGTLGDVDVEVRGVGDVGVYKEGDEITIVSGDVTVRLNLRDD